MGAFCFEEFIKLLWLYVFIQLNNSTFEIRTIKMKCRKRTFDYKIRDKVIIQSVNHRKYYYVELMVWTLNVHIYILIYLISAFCIILWMVPNDEQFNEYCAVAFLLFFFFSSSSTEGKLNISEIWWIHKLSTANLYYFDYVQFFFLPLNQPPAASNCSLFELISFAPPHRSTHNSHSPHSLLMIHLDYKLQFNFCKTSYPFRKMYINLLLFLRLLCAPNTDNSHISYSTHKYVYLNSLVQFK